MSFWREAVSTALVAVYTHQLGGTFDKICGLKLTVVRQPWAIWSVQLKNTYSSRLKLFLPVAEL